MIGEEFLWVERYRPRTIDECILPERLKKTFKEFIRQGSIPNLLLTGPPGIGKTTVAKALCNELGIDSMIINGSMNGNIDTLRNEIQQFASSVSLMGGRKVTILDEADYLNQQSTQPALRNFMEEYSKNCGFILTCNFSQRIIEPLHSRCTTIDFKITRDELAKMAGQFLKRVEEILKENEIEYDKKVIAQLIKQHLPDWRKILNELQTYAALGKIDAGILVDFTEEAFKVLVDMMKEKNFSAVRKWVTENSDIETPVLYRRFYDTASTLMNPSSIPELVVTLARYQYQAAFVADPVINTAACLAEIMSSASWRS